MYFHCSKFCIVVKLIGRATSITNVIQQGDRCGAVSVGPSWGHGKAICSFCLCQAVRCPVTSIIQGEKLKMLFPKSTC